MVIIIGAGPIGLACGIELKKRNIPFIILEKGCLVNSVFNYPTNMTFFSTSDRLEIGDVPFISHGVKATRREALEYYRRVKDAYELPVNVYEEVLRISGGDQEYVVETNKNTYHASKIIVSTGFYGIPHRMKIPGEDLPKVKHYYDEPHPYANMNVLVVGGGNSAVDVALETYRCGSAVTMVVREKTLKPGVKYWVRPDIENRIKEGAITCYFESNVKSISPDKVTISTPDGDVTIENDFVLAMTGYEPDFRFLEMLQLEFENDAFRTPVYNEQSMESSRKGLYLAGVVCGGYNTSRWFIENSIVHASQIAEHIQEAERIKSSRGQEKKAGLLD
ncbi:MAG: YpdA family putative bacillithiol disulfide reductase [Balneolales bacterium]|nr:YpdA family putative bacillithiol disulfide reductase [Balneolales bacterium]